MSEQLSLDLPLPNPPLPELRQLWTPDDLYGALDENVLRQFAEDRRLERKSARVDARALGDYFSMWANTAPDRGIILLGVEKDGKVSGCRKLSDSQRNDIDLVSRRYCPDAKSESKLVSCRNHQNGPDFVIAIRVYYRPDKVVETSNQEAFIRIGDEKHRLTADEKRELRITKGEIEYEKEPVSLNWPSDFDQLLIRGFCDEYVAKRLLKTPHTREDILCLNHLGQFVSGKFVPNLACALLFAIDPRSVVSGARIRFMRFDGREERTGSSFNVVKDVFFDGPVPIQIRDAEEFILSQIRNFTRLGADGRFYTKPEYPRDVWLEAVVNASAHRSYNLKNMVIYIKMFDDRMVFESPGGFPPPNNSSNIYDIHNPRNPHLMNAMFYLDFVKCAHEGTRRMRDMMAEANLPGPEFSQKQIGNHQVHVTLRNNIEARKVFSDEDAINIIGKAVFETLTDDERMIINYIAEKGYMNVSDANRLLHRDWRTAKNRLEALVEKGVLFKRSKTGKKQDPSSRYLLKRKGS
jgi:ATP-dependent DNA helicase RecG